MEVTLQPVELIGVDAAIIFSDILIVPQAMGMRVVGGRRCGSAVPSARALNSEDFERLRDVSPEEGLRLHALGLAAGSAGTRKGGYR